MGVSNFELEKELVSIEVLFSKNMNLYSSMRKMVSNSSQLKLVNIFLKDDIFKGNFSFEYVFFWMVQKGHLFAPKTNF